MTDGRGDMTTTPHDSGGLGRREEDWNKTAIKRYRKHVRTPCTPERAAVCRQSDDGGDVSARRIDENEIARNNRRNK